MAIPYEVREQFEVIRHAVEAGSLSLLEVTDNETGEPAYVICDAVLCEGLYEFRPLGQMLTGDPFIRFTPPLDVEVHDHGEQGGSEAP